MKKIIIDQAITKFSLDLSDIDQMIYLTFHLTSPHMIHIYMYNPADNFIAECFFHSNKQEDFLIISNDETSLNAKRHHPIKGIYQFHVFVVDAFLSDVEPFSITIEDYSKQSIKPTISKQDLQIKSLIDSSTYDKIYEPQSRYYKGDMHGHTTYSDGHQNIIQAVETIKKQNLDFMALTEHNRVAFGTIEHDFLFVPSFELTVPTVHLNIHGVKDNELIVPSVLDVKSLSDLINHMLHRFKSCNISLNHMFLDEWSYREKGIDILSIHTIEIICDPTYPTSKKANQKAIAFLDFLWNRGYCIYGIGGSDSHNLPEEFYKGSDKPSIYGDPATYVYCAGLSIEHLIQNIKKGHCYVAREVTLDISMDEILPGDQIEQNIIYQVTIPTMQNDQQYIGEFILNGNVVKRQFLTAKNNRMIYATEQIQLDIWWLRFQLRNGDDIVAYVNPIYKGSRCGKSAFIEDLIEEFTND